VDVCGGVKTKLRRTECTYILVSISVTAVFALVSGIWIEKISRGFGHVEKFSRKGCTCLRERSVEYLDLGPLACNIQSVHSIGADTFDIVKQR
jgi:hypothetical protein